MRMLHPRDELRLCFETTDEGVRVRELGPDHLDRDAAVRPGLGRVIDPPERALADRLVDHVTPKRSPAVRRPRSGVAAGDRAFELDRVVGGIEAGLLDEARPEQLELPQRLGLTAGGVQRLREQAHRAFPQRMFPDKRLQLGDGVRPVARRDQACGPLLGRDHALLVEPRGHRDRPPLVTEGAERASAPEHERAFVECDGRVRPRSARFGHQRLEHADVELACGWFEEISAPRVTIEPSPSAPRRR